LLRDRALVRLADMLLIEQSEEWRVQRRYVCEASLWQVLLPDTTVAENVNIATKKGVIELHAA
jgi:hypothetical protein